MTSDQCNKLYEYVVLDEEAFKSRLDEIEDALRISNEVYLNTEDGSDVLVSDELWDKLYNRFTQYRKFNTDSVSSGASDVEHFMSDIGGIDIKLQDESDLDKLLSSIDTTKVKYVFGGVKIDGISVMLSVKKGHIVRAMTRGGNGKGVDITLPVRNMKLDLIPDFKERLGTDDEVYVRAEIAITESNFELYKEKMGVQFKDKRSAVAGLVRRLTFGSEDLSLGQFLLVIPFYYELPEGDHKDIIGKMADIRYTAHSYFYSGCEMHPTDLRASILEIQKELVDYRENRCDVDLDGGVYYICYDNDGVEEFVRFAYKFDPFNTEVELLGIEWDFSRTTGIYTPIGLINTTYMGREFRRVSLANAGRLMRERFYIGEKVKFEYRSDVMGYLSKIGKIEDSPEYQIPNRCGHCDSELVLRENKGEFSHLYCPMSDCSGKAGGKFLNYLDKMDIKGIQEKTIASIVEHYPIYSIWEFFDLSVDQLMECGLGPVESDNFVNGIRLEEVHDYQILGSQNIPLVSRGRSRRIMEHISLDNLVAIARSTNIEDFMRQIPTIPDIGEATLVNLYAGINEDVCHEDIVRLRRHYDNIGKLIRTKELMDANKGSEVEGKNFVITGSINLFDSQKALVEELTKRGAKVSNSVTAKTDYLINNNISSTSTKNKRAKELNIPIIDEKELQGMLK